MGALGGRLGEDGLMEGLELWSGMGDGASRKEEGGGRWGVGDGVGMGWEWHGVLRFGKEDSEGVERGMRDWVLEGFGRVVS